MNWNRGILPVIVVFAVLIIFPMVVLNQCTAVKLPSGSPAGGTGMAVNFTFLLLIIISLVCAVVSISRGYNHAVWGFIVLTGFFVLLAIGVNHPFNVEVGKISGYFTDNISVLALVVFAALAVFGWTKTEGKMKSFLGFTSGVIILFWMYLMYLGHSSKIKIGFLDNLFPDDISKIIFTISFLLFLFAIWKQSKFFYLLSFAVLLAFLGNSYVNPILDRYPDRLKPSLSGINKHFDDLQRWLKKFQSSPALSPPATLPPRVSPTPPPSSHPRPLPPLQKVNNRPGGKLYAHINRVNDGKPCVSMDEGYPIKIKHSGQFVLWPEGTEVFVAERGGFVSPSHLNITHAQEIKIRNRNPGVPRIEIIQIGG